MMAYAPFTSDSKKLIDPKIKVMKKILLSLVLTAILGLTAAAQAPQKFNYQAVARDNAGAIIKNQSIGLRIIIEDASGAALYTETHQATTNDYGLFILSIGAGTTVLGTLGGVNWAGGDRYVKVDVDATGGTNYTTAGTSQLLSVPYALYAENSGNGGDNDATNELQELTFNAATGELTLSNGNTITLPLATGGDNWGSQTVVSNGTLTGNGTSGSPLAVNGMLTDNQTLSLSGTTLSITGGNNVNLSTIDTDDQTLSLTGSTLSIAGGNSVNLSGINTDAQNLTLSGNTLSISGGNSVTLPSGGSGLPASGLGATLRHNGTGWVSDSSIFNNGSFIGIGTTQPIGAARFVLSSQNNTGFGGMYVNTAGTTASPFYGYATGGSFRAYTYFDGTNSAWHFNENNINRFTVLGGNFGINNINPTKRLDVTGSVRFNTGISATGKVLVGTAFDGSAEWGTVGDDGITDMQRHFWISANDFGESVARNEVVRHWNLLKFDAPSFDEDVTGLMPIPSDYAGGNVLIEIYFSTLISGIGTGGFSLAVDGVEDGASLLGGATGLITPPLINIPANSVGGGPTHKQSFTYTGLTANDKFLVITELTRNAAGTYPNPLYFMGVKVTYTAKR